MNRINPAVVLRNHLAQHMIEDCANGNATEFEALLASLRRAFDAPADARHIAVSWSS
jgi:uncharacterized protein YdiU (UPF0061 family)